MERHMASALDDELREDAEIYNRRAAGYGSDDRDLEHAIPKEMEDLYRQDLEEVLGPLTEYRSVLEVGAGNGVFTQLLKQWGCGGIIGIDISEGMLTLARSRLPDCRFELVTSETDSERFEAASFDLIISRQLACHLIDPIAVFAIWKTWLKPEGRIAVIDGLWTRKDWGPPSSSAGVLVDKRPLSCTQTWATVSYLLGRAGTTVTDQRFLGRVNSFGKERYAIGDVREPIFRFVVVAAAGGASGQAGGAVA
jgi:SAM-dependent methyltransferase